MTGASFTDDHRARVLLMMMTEGGNERVWHAVDQRGAPTLVDELLRGTISDSSLQRLTKRLPHASSDLDEMIADQMIRAKALGARLIIPGDRQWPTQLNDLAARAPLGVWVLGNANLRLLALRSIAIVGARAATSYGQLLARTTAGTLADRGWLVVSGGAFGIDVAAHRGALGAGGTTACVLAGGVDVAYPRSHENLFSAVARDGLLLSEAALGAAAQRQRFLTRNRIIAALARATIVVEAALRSGSRTTAREAGELLRLVMAFPGPVTSVASAGTHELIKDGQAVLVTDADDVVHLLGEPPVLEVPDELPVIATARSVDYDHEHTEALLGVLPVRGGIGLDELASRMGADAAQVGSMLGVLELTGRVERNNAGWRRARP